jgi:hypothetical protein
MLASAFKMLDVSGAAGVEVAAGTVAAILFCDGWGPPIGI